MNAGKQSVCVGMQNDENDGVVTPNDGEVVSREGQAKGHDERLRGACWATQSESDEQSLCLKWQNTQITLKTPC